MTKEKNKSSMSRIVEYIIDSHLPAKEREIKKYKEQIIAKRQEIKSILSPSPLSSEPQLLPPVLTAITDSYLSDYSFVPPMTLERFQQLREEEVCDFSEIEFEENIDFSHANLIVVAPSNAQPINLDFSNASLVGARFIDQGLQGVCFNGSNLTNAFFENCDLQDDEGISVGMFTGNQEEEEDEEERISACFFLRNYNRRR